MTTPNRHRGSGGRRGGPLLTRGGAERSIVAMTRFLLATYTAAGHVAPFEPVARELVARGHDVHWYAGARSRDKVLPTVPRHVPLRHAPDVDASELDAAHPRRAALTGLKLLRYDVREVFMAAMPGQV